MELHHVDPTPEGTIEPLTRTDLGERSLLTIEGPGPVVSEADISKLEMRIGTTLPEDYRRFLLDFNGGAPVPSTVDIPGFAESPTDVQVFFGLSRAVESSCLDWNLTTLAKRLENELLPIATDSCGSVFCLSFRRKTLGADLYCDLQSVFGDFEATPQLYEVAPTFQAFLNMLHDPT